MNISTKYLLLFSFIFVGFSSIVAQTPVQVKNKNNIHSFGLHKFKDKLFCIGSFGKSGTFLLNYNVSADSFLIYDDSNSNKISFSGYSDCIYELNNKLFIKGKDGLFVMDEFFEITKLNECVGDYNYIFPHTSVYNEFYFSCGNKIWKTDGTNIGTVLEVVIPNISSLQLNSCEDKLIISAYGSPNYKRIIYDLSTKQLENISNIVWDNEDRGFNEAICDDMTFYFSCEGNLDTCSSYKGDIKLFGSENGARFTKSNNHIYYQSSLGTFTINPTNKDIISIDKSKKAVSGGHGPVRLLKYNNYIGFFSTLNGLKLNSFDDNNSTLDSFKISNNKNAYFSAPLNYNEFIIFKAAGGIYRTNLSKIENTILTFDPIIYNLQIDTGRIAILNNILFFDGYNTDVFKNSSIYKLDLNSLTSSYSPIHYFEWKMIYDPQNNSTLTFNSNRQFNLVDLEIYDYSGKFISKTHFKSSNQIQVEIGDMIPGYYCCTLFFDGKRNTFNFIKTL